MDSMVCLKKWGGGGFKEDTAGPQEAELLEKSAETVVVPSLRFHVTKIKSPWFKYLIIAWICDRLSSIQVSSREQWQQTHTWDLCVSSALVPMTRLQRHPFVNAQRGHWPHQCSQPQSWSRGSRVGARACSFSWRADLPGVLLAEAFTGGVGFYLIWQPLTQNSREYLERLILLPALFFTILRLSCNDLKLQVLFRILKRFPDNLAGRFNFIVKKIPLCSHVRLCQEHEFWS